MTNETQTPENILTPAPTMKEKLLGILHHAAKGINDHAVSVVTIAVAIAAIAVSAATMAPVAAAIAAIAAVTAIAPVAVAAVANIVDNGTRKYADKILPPAVKTCRKFGISALAAVCLVSGAAFGKFAYDAAKEQQALNATAEAVELAAPLEEINIKCVVSDFEKKELVGVFERANENSPTLSINVPKRGCTIVSP